MSLVGHPLGSHRPHLTRPDVYRATLAAHCRSRFPRPVVLRAGCGHMLGIGYLYKHQGFLTWRSCR